MTDIIPQGAMARVLEGHDSGDGWTNKGLKFIVQDYVGAEDSEDGVPFYVGDGNGGHYNIYALAEHVEQVMSPEQVSGRQIPTANKLANALISSITGSYGPFFIHTGGPAYDNEVEFAGTTSEGLEFGFTLKITELGEVDW